MFTQNCMIGRKKTAAASFTRNVPNGMTKDRQGKGQAMTNKATCQHPEFAARVECQRARDTGEILVRLLVKCSECDERFVADSLPVVIIQPQGKPCVIEGGPTMLPMVPQESAKMCKGCNGQQVVAIDGRLSVCVECGGRGRQPIRKTITRGI
jgi:DnaJ-class molecular chaperone